MEVLSCKICTYWWLILVMTSSLTRFDSWIRFMISSPFCSNFKMSFSLFSLSLSQKIILVYNSFSYVFIPTIFCSKLMTVSKIYSFLIVKASMSYSILFILYASDFFFSLNFSHFYSSSKANAFLISAVPPHSLACYCIIFTSSYSSRNEFFLMLNQLSVFPISCSITFLRD